MTKSILIVAATDLEIKPLLHKIYLEKSLNENLRRFSFGNKTIDVLITSIGMVATTFHLTQILGVHKYDYIINAGICGAFDESLHLGDVVHVLEDSFADIAIDTDDGLSPIKLNNSLDKKMLTTSLKNANPISTPSLQKLKKAKGITVNTISSNKRRIDYFMRTYAPDVESMEGASFLYVCNTINKPCTQIRSISNYVGNLNKEDWNIVLAINNLAEVVFEVIRELGELN